MSTDARLRTRVVAVIALALLALALAVVNMTQPPRLRTAEVNPDLTVSREAQRLVLNLTQPVETIGPDAVTITPAAPFEVESDGSRITIRFTSMLHYATDYQVEIAVASAVVPTSGTIHTAFTTPDPQVYTLVRSDTGDRLMQHRLHNPAQTVAAFEAPGIQDYAVMDQGLAVVTAENDGTALLSLPKETGMEAVLGLDELTQLHADRQSSFVGVVGSGTDSIDTVQNQILFLFDVANFTYTTVTGALGDPIPVTDWRFVPGTASVVVRTESSELMLFETWPEERLLPLGISGSIEGFLPGTTTLAVTVDDQERLFDFSEAAAGAIDASVPEVTSTPPAQLAQRDDALAVAQEMPADEGSRIGRVCASPNGEMFSVEIISAKAVPDGSAGEPGFTGTTTRFVRIEDGSEVRSVIGGLSNWCG